MGQPTAKPARALAAPTVAPAVADFMSRAPLSQDLAVFPSQATSSHCPGPAECKTSRAQGKRRFPGAPLPSEGLQPLQHGQLAYPGQHEPGPGRRPLPTGPGQAGDVHWGEASGQLALATRAWGCPQLQCVVMLCRGAKDWLGLAGCRARFAWGSRERLVPGFLSEKRVRARAAI